MNSSLHEAKIDLLFYREALAEAERDERLPRTAENVEKIARAKKQVDRLRRRLIASVQKMQDLMVESTKAPEGHRYMSPFIGNAFTVLQDGQVVFDGGVSFSRDEVNLLEGRGQEVVVDVYRIKEVFSSGARLVGFSDSEATP